MLNGKLKNKKLTLSFYLHSNVEELGRLLLGKLLFTKIDSAPITGGIIVETESYKGVDDKACHAFGGKKTDRNKFMYRQGGCAYIYLCYGMHHLLNVVTNKKDIPHAILIRAIKPTLGIETMLKRRGKKKLQRSLTAGPGALTQALGINLKQNGVSFLSSSLWIEHGKNIKKSDIIRSPRVGVSYAKEDAFLPLRFRIKAGLTH